MAKAALQHVTASRADIVLIGWHVAERTVIAPLGPRLASMLQLLNRPTMP